MNVDTWQLTVDSWQLTVDGWRLIVDSWQYDRWEVAVDSLELALQSWQLTIYSWMTSKFCLFPDVVRWQWSPVWGVAGRSAGAGGASPGKGRTYSPGKGLMLRCMASTGHHAFIVTICNRQSLAAQKSDQISGLWKVMWRPGRSTSFHSNLSKICPKTPNLVKKSRSLSEFLWLSNPHTKKTQKNTHKKTFVLWLIKAYIFNSSEFS